VKREGIGEEFPVSEMIRKLVEMPQTGRRWPSPTKESVSKELVQRMAFKESASVADENVLIFASS